MTEIVFTDAAVDDLRRIGPDAVPRVLRRLLLLDKDPKAGYPLGSELTGFRKLIVGRNSWRFVYRIAEDGHIEVCEIWAIGERADAEVYAEAAMRIRQADSTTPAFARLADVIEQLGKLGGGVKAPEVAPTREPVPDWLAERLIHIAGMPRETVAALDLQEAVDAWTEHMSRPNRPLPRRDTPRPSAPRA
ncbi:type II toxin-antitoxin system RelE family toxin [Phytomonospora endophytica]|uniref:mRNA interferase RelE/StbE n=1 Tax=Phytomonospora endophytica TaxID=714109 RepID=A0A841FVA6_9ACTN|nr:type II toxin-antitoxin system RelE/ParE family toxin [Phytomonospora endophytica]MBB6037658.1 mRNA interferase RelE/StbE [Phytomonospora endophytica]GIG67817.1 hypothetical protein Pen01_41120 [Phytomonospora endophytica]